MCVHVHADEQRTLYRMCVGIAWCESILLSAIDGWVQFAVSFNRFCFYFDSLARQSDRKKSRVCGGIWRNVLFFNRQLHASAFREKTQTRECHIAMFCARRRSKITILRFIRSSNTISEVIYSHSIESPNIVWISENAAWNRVGTCIIRSHTFALF